MPCNVSVITGTGRAGTTFLVGLLSLLGFPTGFTNQTVFDTIKDNSHAGLESFPKLLNKMLECTKNRRVFKNPRLIVDTDWLRARNLDTIIVPVRDSTGAAASREYQSTHFNKDRGGWSNTGVQTYAQQLAENNERLVNFLWHVSTLTSVRVIFLQYPLHVLNASYSYQKMAEYLHEYKVSRHDFAVAHSTLLHKEWVHQYPKKSET